MNYQEKENLFREYLSELLDEHFPKGKSKDRGVALVMFAWAMIAFERTMLEAEECPECGSDRYGRCLNSCVKSE